MIHIQPTLNACLNFTSFLFLLAGYWFIRRGDRHKHQNCMVAALTASALFLVSYVIYHFNTGSRPFEGEGTIRILYFGILLSHTVLAMAVAPMVLITVTHAIRRRFARHRRLARWTLPFWLYVSLTGVLIYLMLYVIWT